MITLLPETNLTSVEKHDRGIRMLTACFCCRYSLNFARRRGAKPHSVAYHSKHSHGEAVGRLESALKRQERYVCL